MPAVKVTDPMFAKAIADLSANNSLFYTPKQLLYFLDRRLRSKASMSKAGWIFLYFFVTGFFSLLIGSFLSDILNFSLIPWVAIVVSTLFVYLLYRSSRAVRATTKQRRASAESLIVVGVIILVVGIIISITIESFLFCAFSIVLGMMTIYLGRLQKSRQSEFSQEFLIGQSDLAEWLIRWQNVNGSIAQLLPPPNEQAAPVTISPEISTYSFDRLVVCDTAAIAQLLIANNFHFENNCAILSITGYPQSIFDTTMQMLRRNPALKVYVFHDCSPRGVELIHRLSSSERWFQNSNVVMIDVGLLPKQILAAQGMFIQSSPESAQAAKQLSPEVRDSLSIADVEWLEAGNFVELESFSPQRLIQVLNRGIAGTQELDASGSDGFLLIGDSGYVYSTDSFG
jgi:hypothetical protein